MVEANNNPTLNEVNRRLMRVELLLDERIATVDMLRSTEKLQEARDVATNASIQASRDRINKLEIAQSRFAFLLISAFLALLIQFVIVIINFTGRGGG